MAGRAAPYVSVGNWRFSVLAVCGLFGMLPDVDFLLGEHRGVTHTVGASLAVGALVAVIDRRPAVWFAVASAYCMHVLLDWLGTDTVAPIGIMVFWPVDQTFYLSPYHLFPPVCRQFLLPDCWVGLMRAIWWELLLLGPLALAGLLRSSRQRTTTIDP